MKQRRNRCLAMISAFAVLFSNSGLTVFAEGAAGEDSGRQAPVCGFEEHVHSDDCYEQVLTCGTEESDPQTERVFHSDFQVHYHTNDCKDEAGNLICGLVESMYYHTHNQYCKDEEGHFVCGLEKKEPHEHADECYREDRTLVCNKAETEGHQHDASCYETRTELICERPEDPGHHHTEACYTQSKELTCGEAEDPGHHHTESCYTHHRELTCGEAEDPGHHHTESCYTHHRELTCGEAEDPGHHHTEACYIQRKELTCGKTEDPGHHHTEACYTQRRELTCGEAEDPGHHHTEACYVQKKELTCGTEEDPGHHHTEACYVQKKELTCGTEEDPGHHHTAECYHDWEEYTCGLEESEEHTHTQECVTTHHDLICEETERDGHTHTDGCYTVRDELVCEETERDGHTHTDACYTIRDELACEETERDGHTHTDACYTARDELVCEETERDGHTHTDACYTIRDELACEETERDGHTHTDACYTDYDELACEETERDGHTHTDACYTVYDELVCGETERDGHLHTNACYTIHDNLTCTEEVREGHTHTEACYRTWDELVCGKEEAEAHTHSDACYKTDRVLICEIPTTTHHHTKKCYNEEGLLTCGELEIPTFECTEENWTEETISEGHDHTEVCYENRLTCTKTEHTHTKECYPAAAADVPTDDPTDVPTDTTDVPTDEPTNVPADDPTDVPTDDQTDVPTDDQTDVPTDDPTDVPTDDPTDIPTDDPTDVPTDDPTDVPTDDQTDVPTDDPTDVPTDDPTDVPTDDPTDIPTDDPTDVPTDDPTDVPADDPTDVPTDNPTDVPADDPTDVPADDPTNDLTDDPTDVPTDVPADDATDAPVDVPTDVPADDPTDVPTDDPIDVPADDPTDVPADDPTNDLTDDPTDVPTDNPTDVLADDPSDVPADDPTDVPTDVPADDPTNVPTDVPADDPTYVPADDPTDVPTDDPTDVPTDDPIDDSTDVPTDNPTDIPADESGKAIEDKTEEPAGKPQEGVSEESVQKPAEGDAKNPTKNQTNDPAPKPASKPVSKPAEQITEKTPEEPAEDLPEKTDEESNSKAEEEPDEKQPAPAEQEELQLATPTDLIGEPETDKPEDLTLATPTDLVGEPDTADPETEDPAATEPDAEESSTPADPEEENTPAVQTGWEGTIESGDTEFHVAISFGADACIPEGASLVISEADGNADRGGTVEQPKLTKGALKSSSRMSMAKGAAADEEPHRNIFSLTTWRMDENEPEIILYQKKLDISLVANGEEIEPDPDARITVSLQLPGIEEGQKVEVRHITDEGNELLESSNNGGEIVFVTNGFSLFEFTSKAQALSSWTTETTENTFYGKTQEQKAEAAILTDTGAAEGLEVLEAYNVTSGNDLWLTIRPAQKQELGEMESLVLYSVTDGTANEIVKENISEDEYIRFSTEELSSFALVKDTGYRHKSIELTVEGETSGEGEEVGLASILLDGMMPKKAEATAVDVTADFADYEYPVSEEQEKETKADNSETEQTEETEDEEKETGAAAQRTTLAAFNITIANYDSEYQPDAEHPINVEIVDPRITMADGKSIELWHIKDDGTEERVEEFELSEGRIGFVCYGFSAYAIVEGPKPIKSNVQDLAELAQEWNNPEKGGKGFYISYNQQSKYMSNIANNNVIIEVDPHNLTANCVWYFEKDDGLNTTDQNLYYLYTYVDGVKMYLHQKTSNNNNIELSADGKTGLILSETAPGSGKFYLKHQNESRWLQHSGSGNGIRFYEGNSNATNSQLTFTYASLMSPAEDPYGLSESYGLMYWNGGVAGKAMMSSSSKTGALDAKAMEVLVKEDDRNDKLFVPKDSDISFWKFHWTGDDQYLLSAVIDDTMKYLKIDASGISLVDSESEASHIRVVPGTGAHAGQIYLSAGNYTLTYSGKVENGFGVGVGNAGSEWLNLVEYSELTSDYLLTYTATKISVSDESLGNGSKIVVYTRLWNPTRMRYDFYAVDHDGTLVPCFESGDTIQWIGNRVNTKLWNFVEYYTEGTTNPNYYYELYNPYSQNYIAPQVTGEQILSPNPIGINLDGRRKGYFYTPIIAWDESFYAYTGLKADTTAKKIVSCPIREADDFYFAVLQDVQVDDDMTTVATVDNHLHGITMRIGDYIDKSDKTSTGTSPEMSEALGSSVGGAVTTTVPNLLSTNIDPETGYPTISETNQSLATMYAGAYEVNHLFLAGTYNGSGYFTYDSTQNFATLLDENGNQGTNFTVYRELGTSDIKTANSMKHGQFLPFNDIKPGVFTTLNPENQYDALQHKLADGDPRKGEKLYNVEHDGQKINLHFVVELEASFVQTPSGHDNWGHDIIYEFTGDDDFWLYVDGELVIDLGGIHSALPAKVNFATGNVVVNGKETNLRALFESNFRKRNPNATNEEVNTFLAKYFEDGEQIFRDYTTHTMRIFYMERGGGASNLNMRFNLSSVKPNHVELSKKIGGADNTESFMAEFPYQIWYKIPEDDEEHLLTQDPNNNHSINVFYKDTTTPVKYEPSKVIDGITYQSVFLLKPGEIADIEVPDGTIAYKIIECALNQKIYHLVNDEQEDITVQVNEGKEPVSSTPTSVSYRKDYSIGYQSTDKRSRAAFVNNVDPKALRTLTIEKHLFDTDGTTELFYDDDQTTFGFRLSLASELDDSLTLADQYTYHILNKDKEYCRWDANQQKFVSLGEGKNDFSQLSDAEKKSATFNTSMNGSISKIPASYIVQVRELLVGTKYLVEERSYEIPDGYSLRDYHIYNDTKDAEPTATIHASDPLQQNAVMADSDPRVVINNLKGFGIRVYKEWNDEDYMQSRGPVYFAVFTGTDDTDLSLVEGTVRQLPMNKNTLYWYFEALNNIVFENYRVREVTLSSETPTVDAEGVVTSYGTVTPIANNSTLTIACTQKGESESSSLDYTVHYEQGIPTDEKPNIREDYVTNSREGLLIRKIDWEGNGLGETSFTIRDANYSKENNNLLNAAYSSDPDNGYVTTAFLRKGGTYYLTETKSKQGYFGLQHPLTIQVDQNGHITVTGDSTDGEFYIPPDYTVPEGDSRRNTLTIKNKPYTFNVKKIDKESKIPLVGARFELHRELTIGEYTNFDFAPMEGYTDDILITDENGIIPKLDETLPPGTYRLDETYAPTRYVKWATGLVFTVNDVGKITLGSRYPDGTELVGTSKEVDNRVIYEYILKVPNSTDSKWPALSVRKKVTGPTADYDQDYEFTITFHNVDENVSFDYSIGTETGTVKVDANHQIKKELKHGQTLEIVRLPLDTQITVTEETGKYTTTWKKDGESVTATSNAYTFNLVDNTVIEVTNDVPVIAPTNYVSRQVPYLLLLAFAFLLMMIIGSTGIIKKRKVAKADPGDESQRTEGLHSSQNASPCPQTDLRLSGKRGDAK